MRSQELNNYHFSKYKKMVTLYNTSPLNKNDDAPIMPRHNLICLKSTKHIKEGTSIVCFIAKMSCGRYAVMAADFTNRITYYEVFNNDDLHDTFNDITSV